MNPPTIKTNPTANMTNTEKLEWMNFKMSEFVVEWKRMETTNAELLKLKEYYQQDLKKINLENKKLKEEIADLKEHHKKMMFNITRFSKEKDEENKKLKELLKHSKKVYSQVKEDAKEALKLKEHIAFQENFHRNNLNSAVEYGKKRDMEISGLKDEIEMLKIKEELAEDNKKTLQKWIDRANEYKTKFEEMEDKYDELNNKINW